MAQYEYKVWSRGRSVWEFQALEGSAKHLEQALNDPEVQALEQRGWELWQANSVNDQTMTGVLLIFRRPKP